MTETPRGKRLGTVSEARDYLGHRDGAQTWEEIALGNLVAVRGEDPERPSLWTVYLPDEEADRGS